MSKTSDMKRKLSERGYRNLASRRGGVRPNAGRKAPEDRPCIVACPYCLESVLATRGVYFDMVGSVEVKHPHQPERYYVKEQDR